MLITKFSLLLFVLFVEVFNLKIKIRSDEDDLYGEELDDVIEVYNKSNTLYKAKQVEYFSKYY